MSDTFKFHDLESAPEASKELLSRLFAELVATGSMRSWQSRQKR